MSDHWGQQGSPVGPAMMNDYPWSPFQPRDQQFNVYSTDYQTHVTSTALHYGQPIFNDPAYPTSEVHGSPYGYGHLEYQANDVIYTQPGYPIPSGTVPMYDESYTGIRSGSFSSESSIQSSSSYSSSGSQGYSPAMQMLGSGSMRQPLVADPRAPYFQAYPDQTETPSSYSTDYSFALNGSFTDTPPSFGPNDYFNDQPASALPDPTFQFPSQQPVPSYIQPPQSVSIPQNMQFTAPISGQSPPLIHPPVNDAPILAPAPIPLHTPQPRRLFQPPLQFDDYTPAPSLEQPLFGSSDHAHSSRNNDGYPLHSFAPKSAPKSKPLVPAIKPAPLPPLPSRPSTPSTKDTVEYDTVPMRTLADVGRQSWPCKYEAQIFTAEDMRLPAVKRRRIYINSLEQACNQMYALLEKYGLQTPPQSGPRGSYLSRNPKSRDTKLTIVKAKYEETLLREHIVSLTEKKNAHANYGGPVSHHPHSITALN